MDVQSLVRALAITQPGGSKGISSMDAGVHTLGKRSAEVTMQEERNVKPKLADANMCAVFDEMLTHFPPHVASEMRETFSRRGEYIDGELIEDLCAHAVVLTPDSYTPETYAEAMQSLHAERWKEGLLSEIKSLHENNAWILVERQDWMKVIPSRWLFKIKTDQNNVPVRYKCRLVAGGHRSLV
jgi:hypothetical protein